MILTYVEAVKTVDPKICTGKLSGLWLALASVYEKQGDLENARFTMSKATEASMIT
jgi:pre-mRNA-splicing factor SYF1